MDGRLPDAVFSSLMENHWPFRFILILMHRHLCSVGLDLYLETSSVGIRGHPVIMKLLSHGIIVGAAYQFSSIKGVDYGSSD